MQPLSVRTGVRGIHVDSTRGSGYSAAPAASKGDNRTRAAAGAEPPTSPETRATGVAIIMRLSLIHI